MSWANLHAVALLAMPVLTCITCAVVPRRRPTGRQVTDATVLAGGAIFIVMSITSHLCLAGNPAMQCLVAGACLWTIVAFVKSKWFRAVASVVLIAAMYALSAHYASLVHDREWVGSGIHLAALEKSKAIQLDMLRSQAQKAGVTDEVEYPAGWLRDLAFGPQLVAPMGQEMPYRGETVCAWHSSFTRLTKVNRITQDYWYPGGRLADAAQHIEHRDAPQSAVIPVGGTDD